MKKSVILFVILALVLACFAGCASNPGQTDKTIKVGATATPHGEILEQVKQTLADQGWTLELVIYDDYILPNKALADKELDANFFQHKPYLDSYNAANGTKLVSAFAVHYEPLSIHGNGVASLSELAPGATVIIPADDSNQTRALFLLAQEGLIELAAGASVSKGVTILDVADAKGLNLTAVQADTVPAQLANSDPGTIAVINGNYALSAGLKIENALALEDASGDAAQTYANAIVVRDGDQNSEKIQALLKALNTQAVADYIRNTYGGAVVPSF